MAFDMIIKNGIIVTASEVYPRDLEIGIKNGKINCIGIDLQSAEHTKIIDAEGAYITPGGVDSHVHLAQANAPTGDGFETGTRSSIAGGTTPIIAFATQDRKDESLFQILQLTTTSPEARATVIMAFT